MGTKQSLREAYGNTLVIQGQKNKDIVVLDADLSKSTMSTYFENEFPDRFFEMGIAEQNMVSVAVGLYLTGKVAFCNSFSVFITGRAYDQVRVGLALAKSNVKIVGSSAGLSDYDDGATHQSVEDISIMRSLPNMNVIVPCDAVETKKMTEYLCKNSGPVFMRIAKADLPVAFKEDWDYEIGNIYEMKKGIDICILTYGVMLHKSLEAAEHLNKEGIDIGVYNISTIKPLNIEKLNEIINKYNKILIVEEHSIIGGLGSAVLESPKRNKEKDFKHIGINDVFGRSSCNYDDLLDHYGLSVKNIVNTIKEY